MTQNARDRAAELLHRIEVQCNSAGNPVCGLVELMMIVNEIHSKHEALQAENARLRGALQNIGQGCEGRCDEKSLPCVIAQQALKGTSHE